MLTAPRPDGVLLVGDIVDDLLPEENAWTAVSYLAEFPCFYVTGNHEWWTGQAERICRDIAHMGVTVLRGGSVSLAARGPRQWSVRRRRRGFRGAEGQLEQVGNSVNEDTFTILMAHRPEGSRTIESILLTWWSAATPTAGSGASPGF